MPDLLAEVARPNQGMAMRSATLSRRIGNTHRWMPVLPFTGCGAHSIVAFVAHLTIRKEE
jgi:hypothetical protein